MELQVGTFLVICEQQGAFGKSADFNAALRLCKENEGARGPRVRHTYKVICFDCIPTKVSTHADVDLRWVTDEPCTIMTFRMVG